MKWFYSLIFMLSTFQAANSYVIIVVGVVLSNITTIAIIILGSCSASCCTFFVTGLLIFAFKLFYFFVFNFDAVTTACVFKYSVQAFIVRTTSTCIL